MNLEGYALMHNGIMSSLVQVMSCHLFNYHTEVSRKTTGQCNAMITVKFRNPRREKFLETSNPVFHYHIDGLVQERRNSSALALELRLSCTDPSIYGLLVKDILYNLYMVLLYFAEPLSEH